RLGPPSPRFAGARELPCARVAFANLAPMRFPENAIDELFRSIVQSSPQASLQRLLLDRHGVVEREPAAVGVDRLPGDIACLLRGEEDGNRRDLVGLADAPSGVRASIRRLASLSVATALRMSVMIEPGPMALTRMP